MVAQVAELDGGVGFVPPVEIVGSGGTGAPETGDSPLAALHDEAMARLAAEVPEGKGFLTHSLYGSYRLSVGLDEDGVRIFELRDAKNRGINYSIGDSDLTVGSEKGGTSTLKPKEATGHIATISAFVQQGTVEF